MFPIGGPSGRIRFGVADQPREFEAIFRLNHATFAGENPHTTPAPGGWSTACMRRTST